MKFGIIVFPGSNCDRDMQDALQDDLKQEVIMLWHKSEDLNMFSTEDCIILPGGFSYGDYLRCGAIARFSPIMKPLMAFAKKGGKIYGVCNGFQILCESGLLPGSLLRNDRQQYVCKNIYIKAEGCYKKNIENDRTFFQTAYKIPIAHGEGRFYANEQTLDHLETTGQILFRYCNENGEMLSESNPNGSLHNIAGICNEERNIFGMMPHPERASNALLGNKDGAKILYSLLNITQPVY